MYVLYSLTLAIAFCALLPYFAYQALVNRKYVGSVFQRLGRLPVVLRSPNPAIWVHAVSVGEALTAIPLIESLRTRFPGYRVIVSTTTATGQAVAKSRIAAADGFCYFPFDWRFSVIGSLDTIRPSLVILMESELWPNFLRTCSDRRIPVVVANGRISDRSFARSMRFRSLVQHVYRQVSYFAMQSEVDAERARLLGARPESISVCGNMKYDVSEADTAPVVDQILQDLSSVPLVIAGSTSAGEEELILAAFATLRRTHGLEKTRLLIAPRHPQRFDEVARLLEASGLSYVRRLSLSPETPAEVDAILLDSIGELARLYRYAAVVFIGGSLVPKGGHNILEAALHGRPIVVGPFMENFREMTQEFLERKALVQLRARTDRELVVELSQALARILTDKAWASRLSVNAQAAVEANRGATGRHVAIIDRFIMST